MKYKPIDLNAASIQYAHGSPEGDYFIDLEKEESPQKVRMHIPDWQAALFLSMIAKLDSFGDRLKELENLVGKSSGKMPRPRTQE